MLNERYTCLVMKFYKEKESLDKLELHLEYLQKELIENKKEIDILTTENKNLNNKIRIIINDRFIVTNIFLKLFFLFFIIMSTYLVGTLSNFNFIVMLLFSVISPLTSVFMNASIIKLLEKRYRLKNENIVLLDSEINENNKKINEYKNQCDILLKDIIENTNIYNKLEKKIRIIENAIKRINKCYNNDAYSFDIKDMGRQKNSLIKIKTRKR